MAGENRRRGAGKTAAGAGRAEEGACWDGLAGGARGALHRTHLGGAVLRVESS
jgi:hypothetical protein